jgi:predicted enzyme related to lactoylglutathione lyase
MILNRSSPPGPIIPVVVYEDVARAIEWLCGAFGFTERLRTPAGPDGSIHHAQLAVGLGSIILTGEPSGKNGYIESLLVRVEDIDGHCERARQFGAKIVMPPGTKEFGERQYAAEDFAGNRWAFTESVADVAPEEWGARVAQVKSPLDLLPRPRVCYLQIPAVDARRSADFYEQVFGWNIRRRDSDHPSFDDATGNVSGAFFIGLAPMREPGIIVSIWVDNIDATVAKAAAHGGEVVKTPQPDQPGSNSWIATFRDPAGNLIGLYQEGPRA